MRPRKLKIAFSYSVMGTPTQVVLGEVKVAKFADTRKAETDLLCPACGRKPQYTGGYTCECGAHYGHWMRLKRVLKNGQAWVQNRLLGEKEEAFAEIAVMDEKAFGEYADATADEYGVLVGDEKSATNIRKLLIASKMLGKVVILRWKDTYEYRISLLTTSMSGRILLREMIPQNLLVLSETMRMSFDRITDRELEEAKAFVNTLPAATEETLEAHDYREQGLEEVPMESPRVMELEEIMKAIGGQEEKPVEVKASGKRRR